MRISALILCRNSSSRLRSKHFKKIGDKFLIEHTINCIYQHKLINEVYIATGPYSKNKIFKNKLVSKYPNLKFYFHRNENKVVERIFFLSKKIKNKNLLIISGDCPIIDFRFLNRIFNKFKLKNYDFSISNKKLQHEGILLSKRNIWRNINLNCNNQKLQEHPSLYIRNNFQKYKYMTIPYDIKDLNKNIRMSVDTKSDLDFFNLIFSICKKKNIEFNYENLIANKKYKFINSHVFQKNVNFEVKKKIYIITAKNKLLGLGHYKRSLVLKREISERLSVIPRIILIKNEYDLKKFKKKLIANVKRLDRLYIFDIPKKFFTQIQKVYTSNPKIIIDNFTKNEKDVSIIPTLRRPKYSNLFGSKFLILDREILLRYLIWKIHKPKYQYDFVILTGGSFQMSAPTYSSLIKLSKKKKLIFILGPFIKSSVIESLKKNKIDFFINPENYFDIILNSKGVIARFGNSVHEAIALKKKPIIFSYRDDQNRKKDIGYLIKQGFAHNFNYQKLIKFSKKSNPKKLKNMSFGAKNVISIIKHYYKNKNYE